MSVTVSRLLLTLSLLVGSVTLYILLFALFDRARRWSDVSALLVASLITAPVFAVFWTAIWHVNVVWSAPRLLRTIVVFAAGSMAGVGLRFVSVSGPVRKLES